MKVLILRNVLQQRENSTVYLMAECELKTLPNNRIEGLQSVATT